MVGIHIKTLVSADGVVTLQVPSIFRGTEIEAYFVLQPAETELLLQEKQERAKALRSLAGSITDQTFERGPQGEYPVREEL